MLDRCVDGAGSLRVARQTGQANRRPILNFDFNLFRQFIFTVLNSHNRGIHNRFLSIKGAAQPQTLHLYEVGSAQAQPRLRLNPRFILRHFHFYFHFYFHFWMLNGTNLALT